MKLQKIALAFGALSIVATSCRKEGCTDETAINYSEEAKKDDGSCTYEKDNTLPVPSKYSFERDGKSTVSFSGQTQRLEMLSEITSYLKSANTPGTSVDAQTLKDMYANNGYAWTDTDGLELTGSSKQLKSKTAYGIAGGSPDASIQAMFENYMDEIATISASSVSGTETGAPGVSGVWPNDGVKGPYLMNGNGMEHTQLIEKGLMCAVFMSQMTVNYLGAINQDDNELAVDEAAGKYYTKMEHHWDEAFGYFTSAIDFPTNGTDRFWGKYASGRQDVIQSGTKIMDAFLEGRTAIVNKDYPLRDAQVLIINDEIERVSAGTAIHYLNEAKANITNNTARNHVLSEAYAFLNGLKYGYNAINSKGMTANEIDTALGYIGTNFNTVTIANINDCIDLIASKTNLESVKAQL
ncbi:MAG: DUF4856 domain-containing protein [Crocinitomicaceae bacterium]